MTGAICIQMRFTRRRRPRAEEDWRRPTDIIRKATCERAIARVKPTRRPTTTAADGARPGPQRGPRSGRRSKADTRADGEPTRQLWSRRANRGRRRRRRRPPTGRLRDCRGDLRPLRGGPSRRRAVPPTPRPNDDPQKNRRAMTSNRRARRPRDQPDATPRRRVRQPLDSHAAETHARPTPAVVAGRRHADAGPASGSTRRRAGRRPTHVPPTREPSPAARPTPDDDETRRRPTPAPKPTPRPTFKEPVVSPARAADNPADPAGNRCDMCLGDGTCGTSAARATARRPATPATRLRSITSSRTARRRSPEAFPGGRSSSCASCSWGAAVVVC